MPFALSAAGERVLFLPRLEVERAMSQAHVDRADADGYLWILGYQGSALSSLTGAKISKVNPFVEHQMMLKSNAEIALIGESVKWANLAHRLLQNMRM
jgi:Xaa-Pro dipeptidase